MKIKDWLNKGEGGEWYEPYVTNRDFIQIMLITTLVCLIIMFGFYLEVTY